jgi:hypothetical protein
MTTTNVGDRVAYQLGARTLEVEVVEVRGSNAVVSVPVLGPEGEKLDEVLATVPIRSLRTLEAC